MPTSAISVQTFKTITIDNVILGTDINPLAEVYTLTVIPTLGALFKVGVSIGVSTTITGQEIADGKLTFLSAEDTLGATGFTFEDESTAEFIVDITMIIGKIGQMILFFRSSSPKLKLTDDIPREVPILALNKLHYAVAEKLLKHGDRTSDRSRAVDAGEEYFNEGKLPAIAAINNRGGAFRISGSL